MEELTIKKLSFTRRPISVPADYRPMYKIGIIVMILKICCRAERGGLLKLHLLSWALKSSKNMDLVRQYIANNYKNEFSVWGIEPALNRALLLAVAEGICEIIEGKTYQLTEKGNKFYKMIVADNELLEEEKSFLKFVGKNKITDSRIDAISKQWSLLYA